MDTQQLLTNLRNLSDETVLEQIGLIREGIAECGSPSSYTQRNRPVLRKLVAEAERRNLEVSA